MLFISFSNLFLSHPAWPVLSGNSSKDASFWYYFFGLAKKEGSPTADSGVISAYETFLLLRVFGLCESEEDSSCTDMANLLCGTYLAE